MHAAQRLNGGESRWITMDILQADEDGGMIEHWNVIGKWVDQSVSGHSQIDGPTDPTDLGATDANKALVVRFIDDVLAGRQHERLADHVSTESFTQHDPRIADGIEALRASLASTTYRETDLIVGSGDMVATLSRVDLAGTETAIMDLWRVADGRLVEHWDVMAPMPAAEDLVDSGKLQGVSGPPQAMETRSRPEPLAS